MTALMNNLFMSPIWIGAIIGLRKAPAELKRLSLIVVVYLPLLLIFSQWHEVRLQWVLLPVLIPLMLINFPQTDMYKKRLFVSGGE